MLCGRAALRRSRICRISGRSSASDQTAPHPVSVDQAPRVLHWLLAVRSSCTEQWLLHFWVLQCAEDPGSSSAGPLKLLGLLRARTSRTKELAACQKRSPDVCVFEIACEHSTAVRQDLVLGDAPAIATALPPPSSPGAQWMASCKLHFQVLALAAVLIGAVGRAPRRRSCPQSASAEQPTELLAPTDGVPRVIHQCWFPESKPLPAQYLEWNKSWVASHPEWDFWLWSDQSNRQLVVRCCLSSTVGIMQVLTGSEGGLKSAHCRHYAWLLQLYDSFPVEIMRADMARALYLHR